MTSTNDFPTTGVELRYLLVVSDYARSLTLYREVLGATVVRRFPTSSGTSFPGYFRRPSEKEVIEHDETK